MENPFVPTQGPYLEYYDDGRRVQKPVGSSPREAKDAWYARLTPGPERSSEIEDKEDIPKLIPIIRALHRFSKRSVQPKRMQPIELTDVICSGWSQTLREIL